MTTARERADGLRGQWEHFVLPPAIREEFWSAIESALLSEREAGRIERGEEAAKVAEAEAASVEALDAFEVGPHAGLAKAQSRHTANRIVAAIRALNNPKDRT
jgi:hypothetical protein